MMMKQFMAMLKKNENNHPPSTKLLNLAEQLCQELQSSSPNLEKLVGAVMGCKSKTYFLANIHVVRACVSVHIHKGEHDAACKLLKCCKAEEKKELVQLWHEIHYQRFMAEHKTHFLTPLQKFRCRKRNPPPSSLCPEGLKTRNYSQEVRQHLHRFAAEVTANPNKKQRDRLAQDMNLQPTQVYNWFANYRRRKSRLLHVKAPNNSCPEKASAHKEPQDKGSNTPQNADGSPVGISPEQMDITLMPCEPGQEQPPEGEYLKMLESSCMQSPELLYEAGTSKVLCTTHSAEQPAPFGTEAVVEPQTCSGSPVLLPGEAVGRAAANFCQESFVLCSYEPVPVVNYCLPMWWAPCSTRGVFGSVWTPVVEAGIRAPLSTVPQGGCVEASSERIIQQSDLHDESLILRGGQLGTLESIPHSSSQTVFGKPQSPHVSAAHVDESQALGQSQVRTHLMFRERSSCTHDPLQVSQRRCEFSYHIQYQTCLI
ncbi:anomalous homeobox protein isoform X4 [Parus major]|nr:anomalous homeobox protein isoform X4 [Parus major]XP_015499163.1 anomalous homeobox protein isoform X4 [Parus major]